MAFDFANTSLAKLFAQPGISLLRMAASTSTRAATLDSETLTEMRDAVEHGACEGLAALDIWPELLPGLLSTQPSAMLRSLRECGALAHVLPELDALFGKPQADSKGDLVDLGHHQLAVIDELASQDALLHVRLAGLLYNLGKADSPPEHLPTHYRHIERAVPRIQAVCARFALGAECLDLALLAVAEMERVHKATEMRAGALAVMLGRLGAFAQPQRFAALMQLCAADYRAFPDAGAVYPKARLLDQALQACLSVNAGLSGASEEAVLEARAAAIAKALRSERFAGGS
ncbi:tRNA nucleotidyltransferase [Uliginosibacterium sediminicola]|uniref:tRNA nucleotidyltransferase n=1 Tax=Uliginosibacterium sediminicola TaxID=2024550 RepID=A0ABU9YX96_9RHOO